mgnify:CR=1 FL=1
MLLHCRGRRLPWPPAWVGFVRARCLRERCLHGAGLRALGVPPWASIRTKQRTMRRLLSIDAARAGEKIESRECWQPDRCEIWHLTWGNEEPRKIGHSGMPQAKRPNPKATSHSSHFWPKVDKSASCARSRSLHALERRRNQAGPIGQAHQAGPIRQAPSGGPHQTGPSGKPQLSAQMQLFGPKILASNTGSDS